MVGGKVLRGRPRPRLGTGVGCLSSLSESGWIVGSVFLLRVADPLALTLAIAFDLGAGAGVA